MILAAAASLGSSSFRPVGGEDIGAPLANDHHDHHDHHDDHHDAETTITQPTTTTTTAGAAGVVVLRLRRPAHLGRGLDRHQRVRPALLNALAAGVREYLPATIGTRSAIPSDARFSVDISDDGGQRRHERSRASPRSPVTVP
ncbi:MAG: hypothetical protein R2705_24690 [Ilumatobacteraceae bacterium]